MLAMTLRPPVRRAGRDRRQGRADGERVQGGGQLHRAPRSSSRTRTASRTATRCRDALGQQEKAVESGYWPLFRYDPRRVAQGESPLKLDSPAPKIDLARFVENETRFRQVEAANPEGFTKMLDAGAEGRSREVRALRAARAGDEPGEPRPRRRRPRTAKPRVRRAPRAEPREQTRRARSAPRGPGPFPFATAGATGARSSAARASRERRRPTPAWSLGHSPPTRSASSVPDDVRRERARRARGRARSRSARRARSSGIGEVLGARGS